MELEDFIQHVGVRRAPRDEVMRALRHTIRDFCQFSRCWKHTVTGATISVGQPTITMTLPAAPLDSQHIEVEMVSIDDAIPAKRRSVEYFDLHYPEWRTQSGDSFAEYCQELPSTFRFPAVPVTAQTGLLKYRASVKPTEDAEQVDDLFRDEWQVEIAAGARARLLSMPQRDWSDPAAAKYDWAVYMNGRGRARIRTENQYGAAQGHSVRSPYKFAGK